MAIIQGTVVGSEAGFYPYEIEQSLRFNDNDSAYLSRTPSVAGNRKTWTWSSWVKRGKIADNVTLFSGGTTGRICLYINSSHQLVTDLAGTGEYDKSVAVFRDPSAWYHIVWVFDTTQSTGANRSRIYVNGEEIALTKTRTWALNTDYAINNTDLHTLGVFSNSLSFYLFDGYLAETHFIGGTAHDATAFGEFKNGVWIPKAFAGSYGTNGFYLDYSNGASIGADYSGNGNNWTPTNLASTDVMLDSPTNNFAKLSTLVNAVGKTHYQQEGSLKVAYPGGDNSCYDVGTIVSHSGKWYWEHYLSSTPNITSRMGFRIYDDGNGHTSYIPRSISFWCNGSITYSSGVGVTLQSGSTPTFGGNDIMAVAVDADANTIQWYKNGTLAATYSVTGMQGYTFGFAVDGYATLAANNAYFNAGADSSFAGNKTPQGFTDANGRGDFYYAPPAGYLALCTANLPEPAIGPNSATTSDEHFGILLYTGDNTNDRDITGLSFTPDFTWIKPRSSAGSHGLFDVVRGASQSLRSHDTRAEDTSPANTDLDSFIDGGIRVDQSNFIDTNTNGVATVAWNWKANGSGVTNTDGSITSTVSANVDAGFSIVSWQNNNTANQTIGHGLNQTPEFIITKDRDNGTYNWACWFTGFTANEYLLLNTTGAKGSYSSLWGSTPTASVFSIGSTGTGLNAGTDNMIAYVGHCVEGYSKVFSYTGNGSTDGPFQNLGFRPAWVLLKRTDSTSDWIVEDGTRSAYNPTAARLNANGADAEDTYFPVDFLSNGFKIRHAGADHNVSGGQYIGIAFAENPFKYSNAN